MEKHNNYSVMNFLINLKINKLTLLKKGFVPVPEYLFFLTECGG